MNTASLKLCKELYELSGWVEEGMKSWCYSMNGTEIDKDNVFESTCLANVEPAYNFIAPQYNLGYLLRKLPSQKESHDLLIFNLEMGYSNTGVWFACYSLGDANEMLSTALTPENAAASLAIALFQQGILIREPNNAKVEGER